MGNKNKKIKTLKDIENGTLRMEIPKGFINLVDRRYNGSPHIHEEIAKVFYILTKLYEKNKEYRAKEKQLREIEWTEKKIESYFMQPIWKNAHKRLNRYQKVVKETHKQMFFLLTRMDGNFGQVFDRFNVINEDEIYLDFKAKYMGENAPIKVQGR